MHARPLFVFCTLALSSVACGSSNGGAGGGGSEPGATPGVDAAKTGPDDPKGPDGGTTDPVDAGDPPPADAKGAGESYAVKFGPVSVPSGTERTQCVIARLGNAKAIHVGGIHNVLGKVSHHLIVYRTNDTEERKTPFDCRPFFDLLKPEKGAPLMITQKHEETLTLPKGVAFSLKADQMVRLEMHYINTTAATVDATATSTFTATPEGDVKDEADFLFVGNPDIDLPPRSAVTLGPTYLPVPTSIGKSKFFGITGHTHQFGTNVSVATTTGKTGTDTPIYDIKGWRWDEPPTVYFAPPIELPPGGGFRFSCSWKNTSDESIQFGESAEAEMCFFWTYYYPSKGAKICAHTDRFVKGGVDVCCPDAGSVCSSLFK